MSVGAAVANLLASPTGVDFVAAAVVIIITIIVVLVLVIGDLELPRAPHFIITATHTHS